MTDSQIFVGLGLTIALAVASQITADKLRLPAIVLLLPAGFVAGALVDEVEPTALFGDAFTPLVELSVAVILFDGGLDLVFTELEGHSGRIVRRLIVIVCTVSIYGLTAVPVARRLGLTVSEEDDDRPAVSGRPRRAAGTEL